jgi:signal transduction histidine kinase
LTSAPPAPATPGDAWPVLLGLSAEAVVRLGATGEVREANRAAAALVERPLPSVIGMDAGALFSPFRPLPWADGPLAGPVRMEHALRTRVGAVVAVWMHAAPLSDGGTVLVLRRAPDAAALAPDPAAPDPHLRAVAQLAAGVAHEMNSPIQFIRDSASLLESAVTEIRALLDGWRRLGAAAEPVLPVAVAAMRAREEEVDTAALLDEVERAVARTVSGATRMADIVRAMQVFAHPGWGRPVPSDVNEIVRGALQLAGPTVRAVADVHADLEPLPPVRAHGAEIGVALLHLLDNAAQAVADSGRPGRVTVRTRAVPRGVAIDIHDDGVGIAPEIQPRVFEPFFTTREPGRGTGQGLSVARAIVVDGHHGTIHFTTTPGEGTTFTLVLPLEPPTPRPEAPA